MRLGSINSNDGGWKNGKRSAGSVVDPPEPLIKFSIPQCEPLNVGGMDMSISTMVLFCSFQESLSHILSHPYQSLRM